jgi:hypothetical protein
VTRNFPFIKTGIFSCSQRDFELHEFSGLKRALAWLYGEFIAAGEALLAGIYVRLCGEVIGEGMILRHVV